MLLQDEANKLFEIKKSITSNNISTPFPKWQEEVIFVLKCINNKEDFKLIIDRKKKNPDKITCVKLCRGNYCLRRLDINRIHQNPYTDNLPDLIPKELNGAKITGTHLHFYVEGYDDTWAIPIQQIFDENFTNDSYNIITKFIEYCNIDPLPTLPNQTNLLD